MRILYLTLMLCLPVFCVTQAQPRYDKSKMFLEHLDRGIIAVRQDSSHVALSWRTLETDEKGQAYQIYRDGQLITPTPLTQGGTFFIDNLPYNSGAKYTLKSNGKEDSYTISAQSPIGYLSLPLNRPTGGQIDGDFRPYVYNASDASVGDVDGDGQYEIFIKWDPSNAKDNSHTGYTAPTLIDCYRLDGRQLWRINLGRNIRSGAHYVPFIVYDLDGDGKAELMIKTADGTIDGMNNVIGNPTANYVHTGNRRDRNTGRILTGSEYITVFNGLTGKAMDTQLYIPQRGDVRDWGDDHANRSERYLAGVGYFDGKRPSAVFCRGYYTRTVISSWNWDGKKLKEHWTFDTNTPKWRKYAGQGNHNLRIADVDGDGCDEIIYGSMAVDHDGTGLYNTGFGHGDAMHLTAFDPTTDRLQVWDCHENKRDGSDFRDAATGKVIFQIKSSIDVGRCMAADIDPNNPGLEMWSSDSHGIRNIKGEQVLPQRAKVSSDKDTPNNDNTALFIGGQRLPTNFGIWWDGDLLREMLDHETVSKYDYNTGNMTSLIHFERCRFNNGTKSTPCLSGDIIGDWREEVITRTADSNELRIYTTTIPTDYRINCLMQDIPYRLSIAAQNVGYNQPPHTGYYLGPDKTDYIK